MRLLIIAMASILLTSCGGSNAPSKAIPGAAGAHLYDMMEEDSTEMQADTISNSN